MEFIAHYILKQTGSVNVLGFLQLLKKTLFFWEKKG